MLLDPQVSLPVRGRYQARLPEYIRASAWLGRRSRVNVALGLFFLAAAGLGAAFLLAEPGDAGTILLVVVGILFGVSLLSGWYCAPFLWLSARRNRRIYEQPTEVDVDSDGMTMRNGVFSSSARWVMLRRLRENDAYFFFDNGVGAALLLPKRAFDPAGVAMVRRLATARLGENADVAAAPPLAGIPSARLAEDAAPGADAATSGAIDGAVRGSFTMTLREFADATAWLSRRSLGSLIGGCGLILLGVYQLATSLADPFWISSLIALGTLALGTAFLFGLWAYPVMWLAGRKRRDLFTQPTQVLANSAGIRMSAPAYDNALGWGTFQRVRESRSHLYLEFGGGQTAIIPVRAFTPADLARLRALVATARPGAGVGA